MTEVVTAKLFKHNGGQAVRLPKAFRLPGTKVRVRRVRCGVLLEALEFDLEVWLSALQGYRDVLFMQDGREQPPMPEDDASFDP